MDDKIPHNVIRRLPKYYRYLEETAARGEDKVSSSKMSADMGLNASQIRRDLNCFGGFGQQGYGYSVTKLRQEIARILGLDQTYKVIVVGAGRIGQALMGYGNFVREGFDIEEIFDADPNKIGMRVERKSVRHISELQAYLPQHPVDIAFICTPKQAAESMADLLVSLGVCAIWNFAPVDVCVRREVAVENVHLSDSLYVLTYGLANRNQSL